MFSNVGMGSLFSGVAAFAIYYRPQVFRFFLGVTTFKGAEGGGWSLFLKVYGIGTELHDEHYACIEIENQ